MRRVFDRELINSYLTQPDILPAFFKVNGDPKDYPDICFLEGKAGLFVCVRKGDAWSCHAAIPKGARGRDAYQDVKDGIRWLFDNTDCAKIVTRADKTKKHLLHFNGKLLTRTGEDNQYVYYEATR